MTQISTMEISGWGRYPRSIASIVRPERVSDAVPPAQGHMITRGQGRSYGNAAMLKDGLVMLTERLNRCVTFNPETGILRAEAGTTLADVLDAFVPQGWFPSVVPGTKYVSLGGCVAADIHGKNHHRTGTFGAHVAQINLVTADATVQHCSPRENAELFWATVGGMGLTGIMTEIAFKMVPIESSYMMVQHHQARDLDALLNMLEGDSWDDEYSVAWLDCLARGKNLGRGILMRGHHARVAELPKKIRLPRSADRAPKWNLAFDFPSWILNGLTAAAFNQFYYHWQGAKQGPFISSYDNFFFPLDSVANWNRIYGHRGFVQYQCVLPGAETERGLRELLAELARSRRNSFLSVLKRFGPEGKALLSFPREGYTLTLDIPITDVELFAFLDRLDRIVLGHGGRVYLAKEARIRAETFRAMYPRFPEWQRIKSRIDPENRFRSDLSNMLGISNA